MQAQQFQRKRAVLVGLNYQMDPTCRLNGCVNDTRSMAKYLTTTCGFSPARVDVLTDENLRDLTKVSRDGIMEALYGLCIASWKEDLELAVFHYSGHGSQMRDTNGDEKDNMDEVLVPVDFRSRGLISDDFLTGLAAKFNPKTKLVCFFDCCHSGTIMDLPFAYDMKNPGDNGQRMTRLMPGGAKVYCISGCRDEQVSMDAADPETNAAAGAMTSCLLKLLKEKGNVGYPVLQLQEDLNKLLSVRGFAQRPLLTSTVAIGAGDALL